MKFLVTAITLLSGCGLFFDTDSVVLEPPVQNNQNNVNNNNPFKDLFLGNGGLCPDPDGGSFDKSRCDPVDQTGCSSGSYCYIAVQDGQLRSSCRPLLVDPNGPGEPCETLTCEAGYLCVRDLGACARICDRADARGCMSDDVCTPFEGTSIGYCTNICVQ